MAEFLHPYVSVTHGVAGNPYASAIQQNMADKFGWGQGQQEYSDRFGDYFKTLESKVGKPITDIGLLQWSPNEGGFVFSAKTADGKEYAVEVPHSPGGMLYDYKTPGWSQLGLGDLGGEGNERLPAGTSASYTLLSNYKPIPSSSGVVKKNINPDGSMNFGQIAKIALGGAGMFFGMPYLSALGSLTDGFQPTDLLSLGSAAMGSGMFGDVGGGYIDTLGEWPTSGLANAGGNMDFLDNLLSQWSDVPVDQFFDDWNVGSDLDAFSVLKDIPIGTTLQGLIDGALKDPLGTLGKAAKAVGLLKDDGTINPNALSGLLSGVGGYLQGNSAVDAAKIYAASQKQLADDLWERTKFQPVGITSNRFGTANYTFDENGRMTGASSQMAPDIQNMQNRLINVAGGTNGLAQTGMLSGMGRNGDTQVGHLTPGEVVIPREVAATRPDLVNGLMRQTQGMGGNPNNLVVGRGRINPRTGIQEFATEAAVREAYRQIGRTPDQAGLQYWMSQPDLSNFQTVANGVFQNPNNTGFVPRNSLSYLSGGTTTPLAMRSNPYEANDPIANLYVQQMGRVPEQEGYDYWKNRFGSEVTADELAIFQQSAKDAMTQTGGTVSAHDRWMYNPTQGSALFDWAYNRAPTTPVTPQTPAPVAPINPAVQNGVYSAPGDYLSQYEQALGLTEPMGQGAVDMFNLGGQYLNTDPQAQAQQYYDDQQALWAAQREREEAGLLTGEFNRGTYGLATGATSGGMQASNPRLEAYYNANRQQDLGLAARATQGGMDYANFGAGMLQGGGQLLSGMYGTQTASLNPWMAGMGGANYLQGLGDQAMNQGMEYGRLASNSQNVAPYANAMNSGNQAMQNANGYNPWGAFWSGAGNRMQNSMFGY